ncbi:hypothetical protein RB195_004872 [Necator americanus]|uniref:Uncharacterized protein n=1 Tax=Necator americanus TaxID=51031 RepID=A0ABR1BNM9_NECAM
MLGRRVLPPFEELLQCIQLLNTEALGLLLHMRDNPRLTRPLRRKDRLRREKIAEAIEKFKIEWLSSASMNTQTINKFCRRMSRHVTEKIV